MSETKRGGPGRGQGRKPVKQGEETVTLSLRVTTAQREKLARLGGAEWVRGKIDRAKEPNAEFSGARAAGDDNQGRRQASAATPG